MKYIILIRCRLPPLDGYMSVCLVLTIDVYTFTMFESIPLYANNREPRVAHILVQVIRESGGWGLNGL